MHCIYLRLTCTVAVKQVVVLAAEHTDTCVWRRTGVYMSSLCLPTALRRCQSHRTGECGHCMRARTMLRQSAEYNHTGSTSVINNTCFLRCSIWTTFTISTQHQYRSASIHTHRTDTYLDTLRANQTAEAALLWLVTPKQVVWNDVSSAVTQNT